MKYHLIFDGRDSMSITKKFSHTFIHKCVFYSVFLLECTLKNAINDRKIKPQDKKRSTKKNDIEFENRLTVVKKGFGNAMKWHYSVINVLKKKCPQT